MTRETKYDSDLGATLEKHDPYLLWDRCYNFPQAIFFQNPRGQLRAMPDGERYIANNLETNMLLGGMIGLPLTYEIREVRFYPGGLIARVWSEQAWVARRIMMGRRLPPLKLEAVGHLPLPLIDDFSREDQELHHRISLRNEARALFDVINMNELPCVVAKHEEVVGGVDILGFTLENLKPCGDKWLSTYCVLVGAMWLPR